MKKTVVVDRYERHPKARAKCIEYWKCTCSVCEFDFEKVFGDLGKGFIHVHHLTPLSEIGKEYEVDPIKDLRPICPNCHAMIHRENPPLTIEQLKLVINKNR
ncbi:MAG: HNH endonuclease [Saprospiraceae bacterium]|nr:HNH endonuclease [Saprospiraceae bacterium]